MVCSSLRPTLKHSHVNGYELMSGEGQVNGALNKLTVYRICSGLLSFILKVSLFIAFMPL